ncbi:MAG: phage Gp37/Gp68 family protein [Thermoanaerobaculia bacterium]|nr:phage Gp37/Gp68 family protein [Thermoanaerobaculia bacterium]
MAASSSIEWTGSTWNPVTGCTKISPGCKNCYAKRMALRLQLMGQPNYVDGFRVTLHEKSLELPLSWKKPRRVFVNSMSDLFHQDVPLEFILRVFKVMKRAHWHQFQILTKRAERLLELDPQLPWAKNIWAGVSVENLDYVERIRDLRSTGASIKFLSLEPLLGPLPDLLLRDIDWVIVGGESGPKARPMQAEWATDIRDQCRRVGVPFFFKQWGGTNKKKTGRLLEGRTWDEMPSGSGRKRESQGLPSGILPR